MRRALVPPELEADFGEVEAEEPLPAARAKAASVILPGLYVGSMVDGAQALWESNPLKVDAVVNCAQEEWIHQLRKGRCGPDGGLRADEILGCLESFPVAKDSGGAVCGTVRGIEYMSFNARDMHMTETREAYALKTHFQATFAFVSEQLARNQTVLIHCLRGENRSAVVCAAFLVAQRGVPVEEAITLLRDKRGEWSLNNQGFIDQLNELASELNSRTNGSDE